MDSVFEQTLINRLRTLNHTQRSIEKTSRVFLKNRQWAPDLVKLWFKEFRAVSNQQKLAFLHLVNDVLVNSVQKAPQFAQLFEPVLPLAFGETASVQSHHIRSAVAHLLVVWADRQIYPRPFLRQLRSACQRAASQADANNPAKRSEKPSPFDFSFTSALINASALRASNPHQSQNISALVSPATGIENSVTPTFFPPTEDIKPGSLSPTSLTKLREDMQHDLLSATIKPPETNELIQQLDALQTSAPSASVITRQKISEYPAEVSNPEEAAKLLACGAVDKDVLVQRIQAALHQLEVYNASLDEEMIQRQRLNLSLRAYRQALRESCQNTRTSIQDIQEKRAFAASLQTSLDNHVRNLPDDQTFENEFLAPLPSVGDLFR
ncbi:hypothetical protein Aperf_G00000114565 [Anoplocephala perfoliata]